MLKLVEPFGNEESFLISLFSKVQIWFFCSFWLIFCPLDPDPWIRIFLRIRIQEAKILRIQRIRILSTDLQGYPQRVRLLEQPYTFEYDDIIYILLNDFGKLEGRCWEPQI